MKIFITREIPNKGPELLRNQGWEVVVSSESRNLEKDELAARLQAGQFDAVLCLLTDKIDAEVLAAAGPQCKIFANYAAGVDNIDLAAAKERGIIVTNTPGVLTESVAELTFALMLAVARHIPEADQFTRRGQFHGWEPQMLLGNDIYGKILGIVGLGRIGSRVAWHAVKGFGMRALYYDVKRNEEFEKEFGATFKAEVDDVFKEADFISIHTPLTSETRHLVDARRLSLMKPTAFLINTSRGPVIDEAALVDALKRQTIRGAALDVFEHEPELAAGLAELPNVVLTPHLGSATEETRQAMSELAAKNIVEVLNGRPPLNPVA